MLMKLHNMKNTITIQGLTVKQKVFMDTLWAMDNMDQVQAFVKSLPRQDAEHCLSLIQILIHETYEQENMMGDYEDAALAAIAAAMR